jgi:hypothetical protein
MRESRYYIEWIVPQFVDIDVDASAELVDLGRVLTRWLFNWEKIWVDAEERNEVAQIAGNLSECVVCGIMTGIVPSADILKNILPFPNRMPTGR